MLNAALDNHVQAMWLAFGVRLDEWIRYIRSYDKIHRRSNPTLIFVQVSSVEETLVAVENWKVDVIVAQGLARCSPCWLCNSDLIICPP